MIIQKTMNRQEVIQQITSHPKNWFHINFLNAQGYSDLVNILETLNK